MAACGPEKEKGRKRKITEKIRKEEEKRKRKKKNTERKKEKRPQRGSSRDGSKTLICFLAKMRNCTEIEAKNRF